MDSNQSYSVAQAQFAQEAQRLRAQVAFTWPQEAARLRGWGAAESAQFLELGSGPGYVTERLLDLLPAAHITALDLDPRMTTYADEMLGDAGGHRTGLTASIMALPLPNASHDFALARYLFQHLSDPVGAAREVWRALAPGSPFVIIDTDDAWSILLDPPFPDDQRQRLAQAMHQALRGGNRFVGRRLPHILSHAGFRVTHFETILLHSELVGSAPFLDALAPLVGQEEGVEDSRAKALRAFVAEHHPLVMLQLFAARGIKS